ncbi:MAG: peptide deformylase [Lachnospiraceae bacterium]|nr:peptide deformylase [Lachnospiraceae bacterium]
MAKRTIRTVGDRILTKTARSVEHLGPKELTLIDDMLETMYEENGVGLAAPQVGVLKRIVVMDVGEGPIVMVNPRITAREGEQTGDEGCLSVPGKVACVTRPEKVTAEALDREGKPFVITGEGLLARCICHECDHLDGHLYTEFAEGPVRDVEEEAEAEEEE